MNYEEYLISLLFDYLELIYALQGVVDKDYDNLFVDDEGLPITDKEYLIRNKFYDHDMLLNVYYTLFGKCDLFDLEPKGIIKAIVSRYFVFFYNDKEKDNMIRYIRETPLDNIFVLFEENINFGIELLSGYYESIRNEKKYYINRGLVFDNDNDFQVLMKFENKYDSLNSFCKNTICDVYNHYISNGFDDKQALGYTWAMFTHDFLPMTFDKEKANFIRQPHIKSLMLSLIYADLYEDALNDSIIQCDDEKERIANFLPVFIISLNIFSISGDYEIRNRMLKHFILLQDEKEKLKQNRAKTYKDDRIMSLKKYNPEFLSDEYKY